MISSTSSHDSKLEMKLTHVVWIQTAFIGDIVLSTAAANALHNELTEVKQHFITTPLGKGAIGHSRFFESIVSYNKRGGTSEIFKVVNEIKKLNLPKESTVILQPHKSLRSSILSRILGFKTITYSETIGKKRSSIVVPRVSMLHEVNRIKLLLEPIGITREKSFQYMPFLEPEFNDQYLSSNKKYIAIAPGSVWATKKWGKEGFLQVVKKIINKTDDYIVILGSPAEQVDAQFILDGLSYAEKKKVVNLAGKTGLNDLRSIYPKLNALVCNDSSPIHYASAFNVPTVAIFGATKPAMGFGPLADKHVVVENRELDCRPCSDHGPKVCPLGHFKCMKSVSPQKVFDALLDLVY